MLDFEIYLYPNDQESIDDSFDSIEEDIIELIKENYFDNNPKKKKVINNLWSGNYRGALALIDGTSRNREEDLIKIQKETKQIFTEKSLELIFNIIVNTALLEPRDPELLWEYMGNRILLEELCNKPTSLFTKPVNEQLKSIIENGSFWETAMLTYDNSFEWYEKNMIFIKKFLTEDFTRIDIFEGQRGLMSALKMSSEDFLYTSTKKDRKIFPSIMLSDLEYGAIENYYSIIKDIYNNKKTFQLDDDDIGVLLIPRLTYDFENFVTDEDDEDVIYESSLFKDPFILRILQNSDSLKSSFAQYLINDDYDGVDEYVFECLNFVPCKSDILKISGEILMEHSLEKLAKSGNDEKPYFYERFANKMNMNSMEEKVYYYPSMKEMFKNKIN